MADRFVLFLFGAALHGRISISMDIKCDPSKPNFCQVNIDGGKDISMAAVIEDNSLNSTDDTWFMYRLLTLDKYEQILDQINVDSDNETIVDDQPTEFYENAENLQKIQLEHKNLTKIKSAAFTDAINLMEIDLDNNQILLIGEDAFVGLMNLTTLSLAKNNLIAIRSNTFAGAMNLKRLYLNQNKIESIEDGAFNLPALETIRLQNNRLKRLSSSIFIGAPQLKVAIFEENELVHIGDAFTHLKNLRTLILDYNSIEDINLRKFAQLTELNYLSLRKSGIRFNNADTDAVKINGTASKLEELHLAENNLSNGDNILQQLAIFNNMLLLNLQYNELTHLNHAYNITKWFPRLRMINLSFNPVQCHWVEQYVGYLERKNVKILPFLHLDYDYCMGDDDDEGV